MVLKIFYDTIGAKSDELNSYYVSEDWKNYTIKIHALKSSAKLVGAIELSDAAFGLEMAGKEGNVRYIKEHHGIFMDQYVKYHDILSEIFEETATDDDPKDKSPADTDQMADLYGMIRDAAEEMDCDAIEDALERIADYDLPIEEREKFEVIREKALKFDYEGILEILS